MDADEDGQRFERSLPERLRVGEESAFEEFRTRYSGSFYRYFVRRGLPEADAIDLSANCVADIALKVRDHFPADHPSFEAWVNLLRQRAALDWWRQQNRFPTVRLSPNIETSQEEEEFESEPVEFSAVRDALDSLDAIDRDLLLLRHGGQVEESFAEIAEDLSRRYGREFKESSLRQRHARALTKVERRLRLDPRMAHVLKKAEGEGEAAPDTENRNYGRTP
jgi:DNA-directed RNA polymerase specialized sigma24 family protein